MTLYEITTITLAETENEYLYWLIESLCQK